MRRKDKDRAKVGVTQHLFEMRHAFNGELIEHREMKCVNDLKERRTINRFEVQMTAATSAYATHVLRGKNGSRKGENGMRKSSMSSF